MNDFELVKKATDPESFYGHFVELKKKGVFLFALCPFHAEHSPSFSVKAQTGRFKCYGCGETGDIFDFLMKLERLTRKEALEWLASFSRVALSASTGHKNSDFSHERQKGVHRATQAKRAPQRPILRPDAMDPGTMEENSSPECRTGNALFLFLANEFGEDAAADVASLYHLGTGDKGETEFWYVDVAGNVRTAKATRYDRETGRRDKKFTRALHPQSDYLFRPCFYGEHLLPLFPGVPVDIVESEKTALICALDAWTGGDPERLFLATGGKDFLPEAASPRWDILMGRELTFWPDVAKVPEGGTWADAPPLKKWGAVAGELKKRLFSVHTVERMQQHATTTEKQKGWDIADEILRARARRKARAKRRTLARRERTRARVPGPVPSPADIAVAERIFCRLNRAADAWTRGVETADGAHLTQMGIWPVIQKIMMRTRAGKSDGPEDLLFLSELEKAIFGGPE